MAIQIMQDHSEDVPRVRRLRIQLNRVAISLLGLPVTLLVSKNIAQCDPAVRRFWIQLNRVATRLLGLLVTLQISKDDCRV